MSPGPTSPILPSHHLPSSHSVLGEGSSGCQGGRPLPHPLNVPPPSPHHLGVQDIVRLRKLLSCEACSGQDGRGKSSGGRAAGLCNAAPFAAAAAALAAGLLGCEDQR